MFGLPPTIEVPLWDVIRSKVANGSVAQASRMLKVSMISGAIALFLLCGLTAGGQTYEDYVRELKKAESKNFSEADLERIFLVFSSIIMPEMGVTKLANSLEGRTASEFPLTRLKTEKFYRAGIQRLLNSLNPHHRILACVTVASANDRSFNDTLRKQMKADRDKGCKMWSGMALLYLKDDHTSELFDFLVAQEDFGDAHMLPFYMNLDKKALEQTAYEKIESTDPKARILAVQSLSVTGLNPKTDEVVRKAAQAWEPGIKGYAVFTMKALHMGDLKPVLLPLLQNKDLRNIALEALANSPSPEDKVYLESLVPGDSEVPKDVLDALFRSDDEGVVSKWLTTIRDKPIPAKYVFFVVDHPLLYSDRLLVLVRDTIRKTRNRQIVPELSRALGGRQDEESVDLLIALLSDPDSTVRYWAGSTLKGTSSPKLIAGLPGLIRDPDLRTVALTNLAIENKIETLADVYRGMLKDRNDLEMDWRRSAVEYLSAFPQKEDATLFRSILEDKGDVFVKRMAVRGLGNLGDRASVDAIIKAMREESDSDRNARVYLVSLGAIKGDKAKKVVESFKRSKEEAVRELAVKLLQIWDSPAPDGVHVDYTSTAVMGESLHDKASAKPSVTPKAEIKR